MAQGRTYHREKAMRIFNISLIMNKLFDNIKDKVSDFVKMDFAVMELEGMEFHAFHGCLESERTNGNLFVVDFQGELDIRKASVSDALEDTADYGKIYDAIAEEMARPSNLLENLAVRIADRLHDDFPEFASLRVRVSKQNPPVSGKVQWSRIIVER